MPNKDRTGPEGRGSRTGRQMGDCEGAELTTGRRFGAGAGRGYGQGRRVRQN